MDANAAQNKYAPQQWGGASNLFDFKCPSGQLVQLKKISLSGLLQAGLLDEMDTLGSLMEMNVIQPATGRGKKPTDRQPKKLTKAEAAAKAKEEEAGFMEILIKEPDKFRAMSRLVERLVPVVVNQPPIETPWRYAEDGKTLELLPDEERVIGLIYSDSIDFGDQMAIFGEVMKDTKAGEVAAFRDAAESGVEPVEDGGSVSLQTE